MSSDSFVDKLTRVLAKRGTIKQTEASALQKAFKESPKPNFDEFLLDEGLVDKDDLLPALADVYQVPSFDVVGYFFDHQKLHMFPKEFLIRHAIIPIEQDQHMLIFAASNPDNPELLPLIGKYVSYDIHFRVGIRQDIINTIREFYDQALTEVNPDFNQDEDETRQMRQESIAKDEKLERMYDEDIKDVSDEE